MECRKYRFTFSIVQSPSEATTQLAHLRKGDGTLANGLPRASLPSGTPGKSIWISGLTSHLGTQPERLRTMVHELGHTVGLMHTNQGVTDDYP